MAELGWSLDSLSPYDRARILKKRKDQADTYNKISSAYEFLKDNDQSKKKMTRAERDENDREWRVKSKLDIVLMTRFGMLEEYLAKLNKLE